MGLTGVELRRLLERVESYGGPISVIVNGYSVRGGNTHHGIFSEGVAKYPIYYTEEDALIGVLKRDLIERGVTMLTSCAHCAPNPKGAWYAETDKGLDPLSSARGDSELEALLKAWLAAAEVEGWK